MTVTITGYAGTPLTLDKTSLTFTKSGHTNRQRVRVSAPRDNDHTLASFTLKHTASGGDRYDEKTLSFGVQIHDVLPGLIAPSTLTVPEGGSASYMVRPDEQPSADVKVWVTGLDGTDLSADATRAAPLTFTRMNWNQPQKVTLTAGEDDDGDNDKKRVFHGIQGGSILGGRANVDVTVTDNDTVGLTLSSTTLGVTEGDDAEYTVRLGTQPSATVTVAITGTTGTDLNLDSTSLTFTTSNWNTAQTVTVTAGEDDDGANDTATLLHTASGATTRGRRRAYR